MPDVPMFQLHGVGVDYPTPAGVVTAVHDAAFTVPHRGLTVLAGPSGSGKSTLLRVLGLVDRPARGVVRFDGTDTTRLGHAARRQLRRDHLGVVFQQPLDNLLEYLSIEDNLQAAARSARRSCDAAAILARLGLAHTADWQLTALSGGQQQRLAFGCALARGSAVVLADEPTSQLDEASADLVLETIADLVADEYTVVAASHDDRLIALGSRVVWLREGMVDGVEDRKGRAA
ncbi:ABC transporter ATP-binding protein [Amycolatopsis albispora]|uniref:ABC transporter ATP-binding protein n=1 Tax=Amycolatopsis albispora TaxID=1804986 RepID=A0A344L386_9PSEU|nr:ATP-binding cassette domain-containing protein [Amycolatopsis albispora]AXB42510.1 ABC transporter ATP-binding protein [Amycolatopsis albispora]